jgi:MoaA/NifB/PqqE/SkfB family radical SAM enzyme
MTKQDITYFNKHIQPKLPKKLTPIASGIYNPKSCNVPTYFSIILPNGDLHPCNIVEYTHEPILGNVKKQSLKTIWTSKKFNEYREKRNKNCRYCPVPLRRHSR